MGPFLSRLGGPLGSFLVVLGVVLGVLGRLGAVLGGLGVLLGGLGLVLDALGALLSWSLVVSGRFWFLLAAHN